jgi:hypothetical protein
VVAPRADAGGARGPRRNRGAGGERPLNAIPLVDARRLAPAARRTLVVLAALAAALAVVVGAAAFAGRTPHSKTVVAIPHGATAIVVLDLSASISSNTFARIGETLSQLAHSHGRFGLVVFSDDAYEALPPGTPARDLEPLLRYFTLPRSELRKKKPRYPANPWNDSFSAGTRISAGLQLGYSIATSPGVHKPLVILVSDLDDDLPDIPRLIAVTQAYRRSGIGLRIVGLAPTKKNANLFRRLTAGAPLVNAARLRAAGPPSTSTRFPWLLVALTLVAAAALAAHELWAPRLEWAR